jgi:hypothetical protein
MQIAPSKTETERLLLVSPELADVLSAIISRLRGPGGDVPLTVSYDVRERAWNPSMPLLSSARSRWLRIAPISSSASWSGLARGSSTGGFCRNAARRYSACGSIGLRCASRARRAALAGSREPGESLPARSAVVLAGQHAEQLEPLERDCA